MPKIFIVRGYIVYFWANENGEPVHVHISKGVPKENATKLWITKSGKVLLCHNKSRVPQTELNRIRIVIENNVTTVIKKWIQVFGNITYYC